MWAEASIPNTLGLDCEPVSGSQPAPFLTLPVPFREAGDESVTTLLEKSDAPPLRVAPVRSEARPIPSIDDEAVSCSLILPTRTASASCQMHSQPLERQVRFEDMVTDTPVLTESDSVDRLPPSHAHTPDPSGRVERTPPRISSPPSHDVIPTPAGSNKSTHSFHGRREAGRQCVPSRSHHNPNQADQPSWDDH